MGNIDPVFYSCRHGFGGIPFQIVNFIRLFLTQEIENLPQCAVHNKNRRYDRIVFKMSFTLVGSKRLYENSKLMVVFRYYPAFRKFIFVILYRNIIKVIPVEKFKGVFYNDMVVKFKRVEGFSWMVIPNQKWWFTFSFRFQKTFAGNGCGVWFL